MNTTLKKSVSPFKGKKINRSHNVTLLDRY